MKEKRYFDQSYSSIFKGLAGVIFLIFFFLGLYLANRYNSWILFPASALVGLIVTMPTFALGEAIQYVACSYDILHHLESIGYDVNETRKIVLDLSKKQG